MAKPVVFTIDDDIEVLRAVERDLHREYNSEYRVIHADSGSMFTSSGRALRKGQ